MKLPLIADNRGDIMVFRTLKDAEQYIEARDAREGSWVVYDCEGRLLAADVGGGFLGERVRLRELEREPSHQTELRATILQFFNDIGRRDQVLGDLKLENLVSALEEETGA